MIYDRVQLLAPIGVELMGIQNSFPLKPFSLEVMNFLVDLSTALIGDLRVKNLPDLYSFGFWCRRTSLESMRRRYSDIDQRLGRGVVFHIAPSNVPMNFVYSLVAALLSGNASIVRLPSNDFVQVNIIVEAIDLLLKTKEHESLRDHIRLVRYQREEKDITATFSEACDVRVIWGGDDTINNVRRHSLPSRAFDVTFADRYSVCLIGAEKYLKEGNHSSIASSFYNDTYLFDQNACTAPHLVLWYGASEVVKKAQQVFWRELHSYSKTRYQLETSSAIEKWSHALRYVALHPGSSIVSNIDNIVTRVKLSKLDPNIDSWSSKCGFFFEFELSNLDQLLSIINRRYQTLSYTGIEKSTLHKLITDGRTFGVDRIVPIGRTLEFSLNWDGYDLISTLSRLVLVAR
jgi:hypothetical protein